MRTSVDGSARIDRLWRDLEMLDTPQLTATPPREHRIGWTLATWSREVSAKASRLSRTTPPPGDDSRTGVSSWWLA
jgi:hypothetical protein